MASSTSVKKNEEFILDPLTIICCLIILSGGKKLKKIKVMNGNLPTLKKKKALENIYTPKKSYFIVVVAV